MYYITGLADTGRTDRETHSVHWKEKPLSGIHYLVTLRLRLSQRTVTYSKTGIRLSWSYEPDFSMHTLSEQLHATNMVRLAKGVCVCVCVLVQGCYWYFGAAVLRLDTEEDVGMQWLCQCSECWCVALQRWYKQVNLLSIRTHFRVRLHVCALTCNRKHCHIRLYKGKDSSAFICIDPNTGFAVQRYLLSPLIFHVGTAVCP